MTKKEEIIELREQHPDWSQERIKNKVDCSRGHVSSTLAEWREDKEFEMSQKGVEGDEEETNKEEQTSLPEDGKETEGKNGAFEDTNLSQEDLINLNYGLPPGYWFHIITALMQQARTDSETHRNEEIAKMVIQQVTFKQDPDETGMPEMSETLLSIV